MLNASFRRLSFEMRKHHNQHDIQPLSSLFIKFVHILFNDFISLICNFNQSTKSNNDIPAIYTNLIITVTKKFNRLNTNSFLFDIFDFCSILHPFISKTIWYHHMEFQSTQKCISKPIVNLPRTMQPLHGHGSEFIVILLLRWLLEPFQAYR